MEYFEHKNVKIAYDFTPASSSDGTKKLLVLVNGYGRTRLDFRAFRKRMEQLAPHVATLALDNRYCGQTEILNPSEQTTENNSNLIDAMAEDVIALARVYLKKMNLSSFSLLGISMGGMIIQTAATKVTSDEIDNLFLVSTTAGGPGRTWPGHRNSGEGLEYKNPNTDLESTRKNMSRYFGEQFLKNSPLVFDMLCKNMLKTSENPENEVNAKTQFYAGLEFDGVNQLSEIKAKKTVIFTGTDDKIIPKENAEFLNKQIAHSQLIVYPEVGHLILMEEPQKFIQDVLISL
jgi:pimeloyl-ACP methyl ester carboxylesterase